MCFLLLVIVSNTSLRSNWLILAQFKHIQVKFSWRGSSLFIYHHFLNFNFISWDKIILQIIGLIVLFKMGSLYIILAKSNSHKCSKVSWDLSKVTLFTLMCDFWNNGSTTEPNLVPILFLHDFWFVLFFFCLFFFFTCNSCVTKWRLGACQTSWSFHHWQPCSSKMDTAVMAGKTWAPMPKKTLDFPYFEHKISIFIYDHIDT